MKYPIHLCDPPLMSVAYTTHEGGMWHLAAIYPWEYLAFIRRGRYHGMRVAAIRVEHSYLIYDTILAHAGYNPWRVVDRGIG